MACVRRLIGDQNGFSVISFIVDSNIMECMIPTRHERREGKSCKTGSMELNFDLHTSCYVTGNEPDTDIFYSTSVRTSPHVVNEMTDRRDLEKARW